MEKTLRPRPRGGNQRDIDPNDLRPLVAEVASEISTETIQKAIEARVEAVARNMRPDVEQEIVVRTTVSTPFFEVTTRRVGKE